MLKYGLVPKMMLVKVTLVAVEYSINDHNSYHREWMFNLYSHRWAWQFLGPTASGPWRTAQVAPVIFTPMTLVDSNALHQPHYPSSLYSTFRYWDTVYDLSRVFWDYVREKLQKNGLLNLSHKQDHEILELLTWTATHSQPRESNEYWQQIYCLCACVYV